MSKKAQTLRALIRRRLSAAAEEIFELIWEHKEELCPRCRLMETFFSPEVRLHRADVKLRSAAPTGQELWREEEEEEEEEITEFTSAPEKSKDNNCDDDDDEDEDEEEEKSQSPRPDQSSQTEQSGHGERRTTGEEEEEEEEDCGGPEPAGTSDPDPDTPSQPAPLDSEADTEDCSRVCEEPRSALKPHPHDGEEPEALEPSERSDMAASSRDDGSDVERNFALLTKRQGGGGAEEEEAEHHGEEEEEENSDDGEEEEDEEGSDAGEEESDSGGEEEEEEVEEDRDGESSEEEEEEDEEDEDPEVAAGSGEIQTREDIKRELSNMSFEDVMKLRNKVGTKVYDEVAYGNSKPEDGEERKKKKKKRLNKNRPMEISAKRPAPFLRQVVAVKKPAVRDPRFDDLSGEYRPEIFEKTYKFIDDIKRREKEVVQKQLRKTKTSGPRKEKLQFLLKRMENQERASKSREQQRERELQFKRQQRERANQGARPFFLKSSEKKKLQLAEKYEELKRSGKLQNFLSKKRKRNAGKDRRKLPNQPQGQRGRQNT